MPLSLVRRWLGGSRRRLFVADFDLVSFSGHCFNQALGYREAARELGLESQIFVPEFAEAKIAAALDARAILPKVDWHIAGRDAALEALVTTQSALRAFWEALAALDINANDILLITTSRPAVIHAIGAWLGAAAPRSRPAVFFRFLGPEFLDCRAMQFHDQSWTYRHAARELASRPGQERVFFTINNAKLLPSLEALALRRAFFLPAPKYYGDAAPVRGRANGAEAKIYVHANRTGDMPRHVAAMTAAILRQRPSVKFQVRFCKYADTEETARETIDRRLVGDSVELLPAEEDHRQYIAAIESSDIVLLPYDPVEYSGIVSGPFCEAAALGKAIVAADGTWMADQIAEGRAAGVLFAAPAAQDLTAATARALDDLPRLRAEALRLADAFRAQNNCRKSLEGILALARQPQDMRLPYVPPTDFTEVLGSRGYLRGGWGATEAGRGVWTEGNSAELSFQIGPAARPLTLRAHLHPFIVQQRPDLCVAVFANGKELAQWRFSMLAPEDRDWVWREALVPADLAATGDIRIAWRIDRPLSPRDCGMSADPRQLGVMLRALSLSPAGGDSADGATYPPSAPR